MGSLSPSVCVHIGRSNEHVEQRQPEGSTDCCVLSFRGESRSNVSESDPGRTQTQSCCPSDPDRDFQTEISDRVGRSVGTRTAKAARLAVTRGLQRQI